MTQINFPRLIMAKYTMITAGTSPPISIDLGSNDPGMTLQREYREGSNLVWRDVIEDGQAVKSPVDIDALPKDV